MTRIIREETIGSFLEGLLPARVGRFSGFMAMHIIRRNTIPSSFNRLCSKYFLKQHQKEFCYGCFVFCWNSVFHGTGMLSISVRVRYKIFGEHWWGGYYRGEDNWLKVSLIWISHVPYSQLLMENVMLILFVVGNFKEKPSFSILNMRS